MCMIGFDSQLYFDRIPRLQSAKLRKAGIAQLVEHHLAKVDVEGSNPFARSIYFSRKIEDNSFSNSGLQATTDV